jgi:hypothetical protein
MLTCFSILKSFVSRLIWLIGPYFLINQQHDIKFMVFLVEWLQVLTFHSHRPLIEYCLHLKATLMLKKNNKMFEGLNQTLNSLN